MKSSMTEYIIAVFELFEAETKSLKKGLINMLIGFIVLILAGFLALIAFLFFIWGIYTFYLTLMVTYQASFATAGTVLIPVILIFSWVKWRR